MRVIVLTAAIAGFVGLTAGIWLKSTILASAAVAHAQPAALMLPHDMMRAAPANLPVTQVVDPI